MSSKVTITLEADNAPEAAELIRKVMGRSPIQFKQYIGDYGIARVEKIGKSAGVVTPKDSGIAAPADADDFTEDLGRDLGDSVAAGD